jgi:hypothetical protein
MPPFVVDNTWQGIPLYQVNKTYNTGTLDEVEITFRTGSPINPKYVAKLTASGGDITIISNASMWMFTVDPQILPLPAGTYYQSVKLIDDSGNPFTFTAGTITGELPPTR